MKKAIKIVLITIILIALTSCAAIDPKLQSEQDVFKGDINSYAKSNLSSFKVIKLDNGIPVIIKNNKQNRVISIKTALRGGASNVPVEKAGIESIMLQMLLRGTPEKDYDLILEELSKNTSGISQLVNFDYSEYSLSSLDKYMEPMIELYAETMINPAFDEEEFNALKKELIGNLQQNKSKPDTVTYNEVNKAFFKGHPYASMPEGTVESLSSITLDDVKAYYENNFIANRLFVVAVGNINTGKLKKQLNSTIGQLKYVEDYQLPEVDTFVGKIEDDLIMNNVPASDGMTYVRGDFAAPAPYENDYHALYMATQLLDDLLFEIVRSKYSACYTPYSYIRSFYANYGSIGAVKSNVPHKIKLYFDETINILKNGKCLDANVSASAAGKGSMGGETVKKKSSLVDIEGPLEFYKNQMVSSYYYKQQTAAAIADQMIRSLVLHKDFRHYLLFLDGIKSVNAEEVQKAFNKYIIDGGILWSIAGDPKLLNKVDEKMYKSFTAE